MKLIDVSTQNPKVGEFLFSAANLPILADGIRLKKFKVEGATSVSKQRNEFELLLRAAPEDNPRFWSCKLLCREHKMVCKKLLWQHLKVAHLFRLRRRV